MGPEGGKGMTAIVLSVKCKSNIPSYLAVTMRNGPLRTDKP